jgi:hypothetical protein
MFLPQARRGNGAGSQLDDNLWLPPELLHLGHPPYQAATSESCGLHRPRVPGWSSPPVPQDSLHPSVVVLVRGVVDVHHPHPVIRLRSLLGGRGFAAQGCLHVTGQLGPIQWRVRPRRRSRTLHPETATVVCSSAEEIRSSRALGARFCRCKMSPRVGIYPVPLGLSRLNIAYLTTEISVALNDRELVDIRVLAICRRRQWSSVYPQLFPSWRQWIADSRCS